MCLYRKHARTVISYQLSKTRICGETALVEFFRAQTLVVNDCAVKRFTRKIFFATGIGIAVELYMYSV